MLFLIIKLIASIIAFPFFFAVGFCRGVKKALKARKDRKAVV